MRYLAPFAISLCMTSVSAETINTNLSASTAVADNAMVQQATQSVAQKLVKILGLTTVSSSEQDLISLKQVIVKALSEGKPMNEIRLATAQAVKQVTGKTLSIAAAPTPTPVPNSGASASSETAEAPSNVIAANPVEVTLDPETGKMMATVLPGESIFRLAQRVYGKENGRMYLKIFAANQDKIKNINVVVEGQVLAMP